MHPPFYPSPTSSDARPSTKRYLRKTKIQRRKQERAAAKRLKPIQLLAALTKTMKVPSAAGAASANPFAAAAAAAAGAAVGGVGGGDGDGDSFAALDPEGGVDGIGGGAGGSSKHGGASHQSVCVVECWWEDSSGGGAEGCGGGYGGGGNSGSSDDDQGVVGGGGVLVVVPHDEVALAPQGLPDHGRIGNRVPGTLPAKARKTARYSAM